MLKLRCRGISLSIYTPLRILYPSALRRALFFWLAFAEGAERPEIEPSVVAEERGCCADYWWRQLPLYASAMTIMGTYAIGAYRSQRHGLGLDNGGRQ